jgi:predicted nucleic-acid-binding Zn-ribbon protein
MRSGECPKCGRRQERGFVLERRHHQVNEVSKWVEGEPRRSFWSGIGLKGRRVLAIQAQRCDSCGFVELYAPATPDQG